MSFHNRILCHIGPKKVTLPHTMIWVCIAAFVLTAGRICADTGVYHTALLPPMGAVAAKRDTNWIDSVLVNGEASGANGGDVHLCLSSNSCIVRRPLS